MSSTTIKLKRTTELISNNNFREHSISFGEPIFVDNNELTRSNPCKSYIVLGSNLENDNQVKNAAIFKGFWDINKANSLVFYKNNREGLVDEEGQQVYADRIISESISKSGDATTKYFILCQPKVSNTSENYRTVKTFDLTNDDGEGVGIYIDEKGVLYGAAWNDYAENRKVVGLVNSGDVVCEVGDGSLELSSYRLQPCPYVISDTYGMTIGNQNDTPVAISGRVLVRLHNEKCQVGDCVCAGINGEAMVMTRKEIQEYPDRILGIITEIPNGNEEWNGVKINNRVWIKVR